MNEIVIAIISGLCVAVPSIIATTSSNKRNNDLIKYRIEELTEKVEKHNGLVERMIIVEQSTKSAHKRLDDVCDKLNFERRD